MKFVKFCHATGVKFAISIKDEIVFESNLFRVERSIGDTFFPNERFDEIYLKQ